MVVSTVTYVARHRVCFVPRNCYDMFGWKYKTLLNISTTQWYGCLERRQCYNVMELNLYSHNDFKGLVVATIYCKYVMRIDKWVSMKL